MAESVIRGKAVLRKMNHHSHLTIRYGYKNPPLAILFILYHHNSIRPIKYTYVT